MGADGSKKPPTGGDVEPKTEPRVVGEGAVGAGCHHILMVVLFLAHVVLAFGLAISWWQDEGSDLTGNIKEFYDEEVETFRFVEKVMGYTALASLLYLLLFYLLLRACATFFIIGSQLLLVATLFAIGGAALYDATQEDATEDEILAGLFGGVACLFGALVLLWLCCNWRMVQATGNMVARVSRILTNQPTTLIVQFVLTAAAAGWLLVVFSGTLEAVLLVPDPDNATDEFDLTDSEYSAAVVGIVLYGVLILFWGALVITNVSVVTTCGVVGTWYHSPSSLDAGLPLCKPAVWGALRKSCSSFLGSIALGSLLLAVVRTVIVAVRHLAHKLGQESCVCKFICCCCLCCLGCCESIMEWLSEYAYAYMAVYGTPFVTSGYRVVKIMASSGMTAISQTFLTTTVMHFGAALGAAVGAVVGYLVYVAEESTEHSAWVALTAGALIGFVICDVGLALLSAGVKTIFVCCAEDPHVLWSRDPELAELLKLRGGPVGGMVRP